MKIHPLAKKVYDSLPNMITSRETALARTEEVVRKWLEDKAHKLSMTWEGANNPYDYIIELLELTEPEPVMQSCVLCKEAIILGKQHKVKEGYVCHRPHEPKNEWCDECGEKRP